MLQRILFVSLIFLNTLANSDELPPSKDIIQAWWKSQSTEELRIKADLVAVHLLSKELAFIASAYVGNEFPASVILIRPALKEIRQVDIYSDNKAYDLAHNGVSEIVSEEGGSAQGNFTFERSIVQLDGWGPVFLHHIEYGNNSGNCGQSPAGLDGCESIKVNWRFADVNGDGIDDLIEEIVTTVGKNKPKIETNFYLFKNNRLERTAAYMNEKSKPESNAKVVR